MDFTGSFQIAEPCHENWNKMSPEAQGRFCASCQRCVVDFSAKSPSEIKSIYDENQGDVCGRVRASQLTVTARPALRGLGTRILRGLKPVQMFALALAGAFTFLFHAPVKAQKEMVMGKIAYVAPSAVVTGQVTWDGGKPAAGVTVEAYRNGALEGKTTTDGRGRYTLQQLRHGEYTVIATGPHGTEGSEIVTLADRGTVKQNLVLHDRMVLGEMIYVPDEQDVNPDEVIEMPVDDGQGAEPGSSEAVEDGQERLGLGADEDLDAPIKVGEFELTVFPNPTTDQVTVRMDRVGTGLLSVSVMDANGVEVASGAWARFMETEQTINVSSLAAGVYVIRVRSGDAVVERRLVKE